MKFTIAIPAYKATYLKECINSVLAQTFSDFELIIVNDASPEDIDFVVSAFSSDHIKYYKNESNFGACHVVDNWNKCLSYANGDFFILLGDDDKMCSEYLYEFSHLIQKFPDFNIYNCRTIIIDEESYPVALTEPRPEFESVYDSILQRIMGKRNFFISDYVYRTAVLRKNGGFFKLPLAWASDDITCFIATGTLGIIHTSKPLFMYRRNSQTISTNGNVDMKMDAILSEENWLRSFCEKAATSSLDELLRKNIADELKKYIQKKKIQTICGTIPSNKVFYFFRWFCKRKRYKLSIDELLYMILIMLKENRKDKYKNKKG